MKTLPCLLAATALLCGCGKSATDLRIEKLEARIAALETQQNETAISLSNNASLTLEAINLCHDNETYLTNQLEDVHRILGRNANLSERMEGLEAWAIKAPFKGLNVQAYSTTPASPTTMPLDVRRQIVLDAEKKWPEDYDMQGYEIDKQTEAWHKLHQ